MHPAAVATRSRIGQRLTGTRRQYGLIQTAIRFAQYTLQQEVRLSSERYMLLKAVSGSGITYVPPTALNPDDTALNLQMMSQVRTCGELHNRRRRAFIPLLAGGLI